MYTKSSLCVLEENNVYQLFDNSERFEVISPRGFHVKLTCPPSFIPYCFLLSNIR